MSAEGTGRDWPAIRFESCPWEPAPDGGDSRRARLRARGPFDAAVPSFLARTPAPGLPATLAVEVEDAVLELSRFDSEVGSIAAPFSSILLRSESASSSEIERLTANPRGIALAEIGGDAGPNARLIVANVRAMEAAVGLADDFDEQAIVDMHEALLGESEPAITGRWRTQQVWVGGVSPHSADFVPPVPERVPDLMRDLMLFARRSDIPALVLIALTHAQFETIHPFPDGNGRTGRALVHAMLHRLEITRDVTVPVSAGLLRDTAGYFSALEAFRAGDVEPIVRAFTAASFDAVENGRALVGDLTLIRRSWNDVMAARSGSSAQRLLDLVERQPVVSATRAARELGVALKNAQGGIDSLVDAGILRQLGSGRRSRVYEAPQILDALDDFARRSKRPRGRSA